MKTYLILTSYYFTPLHNSYTYSLQLAVEKKTSFLMGISNKVRTFLFYQSFRNWLAKNNFPCQSGVLMKIVFLYQFNFLPIWWRVMTEPAESLKVQGGVTSDALKIEPNRMCPCAFIMTFWQFFMSYCKILMKRPLKWSKLGVCT